MLSGAYFRGSPVKWSTADGETILRAVLGARENPTVRAVDEKKLAKRPPVFVSRDDVPVTVPETAEPELPPTDTTSIYSGLLRMADLIAMQPNLNVPLYWCLQMKSAKR